MCKRYIYISTIFLALAFSFLLVRNVLVAQEISVAPQFTPMQKNNLIKFIDDNDLKLSWDTSYNIGLIRKDNIIVSFQPDLPFVLINFTAQRFTRPVALENGQLWASDEFIALLREVLIDKTYKVDIPTREPPSSVIAEDGSRVLDSPIITKENNNQLSVVPSLPATKTTKFNQIVTLVIDPGHGGKTPGAVGRFTYNGQHYTVMEKNVALEVSQMVVQKMKKLYPQLNIIMTRNKDTYVSLEERTDIANTYLDRLQEGEAMLFVSIHANAALTQQASGYEVWYLPPEYRRDDLVSKELNHSKIYNIINNLREEEITLESARLADLVITGLSEQVGNLSRKRGVKEEKFYVVRNTKMPAILIELGFITNPKEGYNLTQTSYQEKLANGIVQGLNIYLKLFEK